MFENCTSLVKLNLSNFQTNQVENMSYCFKNCTSLINLDISKFVIKEDCFCFEMFKNCEEELKTKILKQNKNIKPYHFG